MRPLWAWFHFTTLPKLVLSALKVIISVRQDCVIGDKFDKPIREDAVRLLG